MIYLSDKIYFDITTTSQLNKYLTYYIDVQTVGHSDWNTIFIGRFYNTGNNRIYINDILTSQKWNDLVISQPDPDGYWSYQLSSDNILYNIRLRVPNLSINWVKNDVLSYYKDANIPKGQEWDTQKNYNLLSQRTNYLPRIPNLPYSTANFWFGFTIFQSDTEKNKDSFIVFTYDDNDIPYSSTALTKYYADSRMLNYYIGLGEMQSFLDGDSKYIGYYLEGESAVGYPCIKLAEIDQCPSKFYVMWQDRTGAYQCQPFSKRDYYNESIKTTSIKNLLDEDKVINKQVTSNWILNSDWLTKEGYKAHESILTSPKIWLFDTEQDLIQECVCTDSQWQDKDRKLFNLTINLKSIDTQNINYR